MKKKLRGLRFLSILLALLLVIQTWPLLSGQASGVSYGATDGDFQFDIVDGYATVSLYRGYGGDVVVPSTVTDGNETYIVTGIGDSAFLNNNTITSLQIPKTVKYIGQTICLSCQNLTEITVDPENQNYSSKDGVLYNKNHTTLIKFPEGLSSGCIPDGVMKIGYMAFADNLKITSINGPNSITNVTIPNSITSIDAYAFDYCQNLSIFNLPTALTSIGQYSFCDCDALRSIILPPNVATIGESAFFHSGLRNVTFNSGLKDIGMAAFQRCQLNEACLPAGLLTIGDYAFSVVGSMTSVSIPKSVVSIGEFAFNGTALTDVIIPESVQSIGKQAFISTPLKTITFLSATTEIIDTDAYNPIPSYPIVPYDTVIYGPEPSTAKDYSEKFNIPFISTGTQAEEDLIQVNMLEPFNYFPDVYSKDLALRAAKYAMLANAGYRAVASTALKEGVVYADGLNVKTPVAGEAMFASELYQDIQTYNYGDDNSNNVSYIIANKFVNYHGQDKRLITIAISGTDGAEWLGNMDLTGTTYDDTKSTHSSFDAAKYNVISTLMTYQITHGIDDSCLLFITGHSRGAAVANLVADYITEYKDERPFYHTSDVFAYTFATPNALQSADLSRSNIFNFCFEDDIITQIPMKNWGYYKNGKTFLAVAENVYRNNSDFSKAVNLAVKKSKDSHSSAVFSSKRTSGIVNYMFGNWNSTERYYNKASGIIPPCSLYDYMRNYLAPASYESGEMVSDNRELAALVSTSLRKPYNVITNFFVTYDAPPHAAYQVNDTHQMYTYYYALKNDGFNTSVAVSKSSSPINTEPYAGISELLGSYRESEALKLKAFALQGENASKLGWNPEDEATWSGITWSEDDISTVTGIDISYKELTGELDLSGLSNLKSLNISGNAISSLNINGCTSLIDLNCAYNQITQLSAADSLVLTSLDCQWNQLTDLDVSQCGLLKKLYFNNNMLERMDVSQNTEITDLYCGNNNLTEIDISSNPLLISLSCELNYLDIQSGSSTLVAINEVAARTGGWTLYDPQKIPDDAIFDSGDIAALKTFANQNDNLAKLQWDLSDPLTWYGVEWTLSGSEYQVSEISLDSVDLTGSLNLQGMASLEQLSCYEKQLTEIDVSDCSTLKYLSCGESGIGKLDITNCPMLLVLECAGNYLDVSEGTALFQDIKGVAAKDGSLTNYTPQKVKATKEQFDPYECDVLMDFANFGTNQELLQWAQDAPGEWNGVEWELQNGLYHVKSIDVSFVEVAGSLDLSGFTSLQTLKCASTKVSFVSLPESVTVLKDSMFYDCNELTAINLPDTLSAIDSKAFYGCEKLTTVRIPTAVTTIGSAAFANCSGLTSISIPKYVEAIGGNCFYGCLGLTSIRFNSETTNIYDEVSTVPTNANLVIKGYPGSTAQYYANKYSRTFETIDNSSAAAYQYSAIDKTNKIVTLKFSDQIYSAFDTNADLKNAVSFAANGVDFLPLAIGDTIGISGDILTIAFESPLSGNENKIKIAANTIEDESENLIGTEILSESIAAMSPSEISISKMPTKTQYLVGDSLDLSGLEVSAKYSDGSSEVVPVTIDNISGFDSSGPSASQAVTVTVGGKTTTFYVSISDFTSSIFIETKPTKLTYNYGEELNLTGGSLTVVKASGQTNAIPITLDMISGYSKTRLGTQTLIVTYDGKAAPFDVYNVLPAPTAPKAISVTYSSLKVSWNSVSGATGYQVYRSTSSSGTYSLITTTSGSTLSYTNTGLATGTTYYYKVRAYRLVDTVKVYGSYSSFVSAIPILNQTIGVKATSNSYTSIKTNWSTVTGGSGYQVYKATTSAGTYALVTTTTSTSWTNSGLTTGKTYYYKVRAYHLEGTTKVYGSFSTIISAKPIPSAPTNFTVVKYSSSSIKTSWSAVSGATMYQIYRASSTTGTYSYIKSTTSTSYINTGLTAGKTYYYKVRAYHLEGTKKVYGNFSAIRSLKL